MDTQILIQFTALGVALILVVLLVMYFRKSSPNRCPFCGTLDSLTSFDGVWMGIDLFGSLSERCSVCSSLKVGDKTFLEELNILRFDPEATHGIIVDLMDAYMKGFEGKAPKALYDLYYFVVNEKEEALQAFVPELVLEALKIHSELSPFYRLESVVYARLDAFIEDQKKVEASPEAVQAGAD